MIEKVGHVSNPLTVIAIFAAISEISLVGGMTVVTPELQHIYIWFVMALPTILVLAFFGVLVWNRRVLYAPSDFRDDTAFIDLIEGGRVLASQVDQIFEQLEATTTELKKQIDAVHGVSDEQRQSIENALANALEPIQEQLRGTALDAERLLGSARSPNHADKLRQFVEEQSHFSPERFLTFRSEDIFRKYLVNKYRVQPSRQIMNELSRLKITQQLGDKIALNKAAAERYFTKL